VWIYELKVTKGGRTITPPASDFDDSKNESGDASHNTAASRAAVEGAQTKHSAPSYVGGHCMRNAPDVKHIYLLDFLLRPGGAG